MIREVPLGVYIPGDSILHRMSAGWKFVLMFAVIIASNAYKPTVWVALVWLVIAFSGYLIARIPMGVVWRQVWPPLPFVILLSIFVGIDKGIEAAFITGLVLMSNIVAATVMTLTTRVEQMMELFDWVLSPLAKLGLPVHYLSLAISLAIRLIPLQIATIYEVLDARKARGLNTSIAAFGTPVIVRSIRRAEKIADALTARGAIDDTPEDYRAHKP